MLKGAFVLFFAGAFHSQASFLEPEFLTCNTKLQAEVVSNRGKRTQIKLGTFTLKLSAVTSVTFIQNEKVAKLFPSSGLHAKVFDSSQWQVETDERTTWVLRQTIGLGVSLVTCKVSP